MKTGPKTMAKKPTKDFVHKGVHFRVVLPAVNPAAP